MLYLEICFNNCICLKKQKLQENNWYLNKVLDFFNFQTIEKVLGTEKTGSIIMISFAPRFLPGICVNFLVT